MSAPASPKAFRDALRKGPAGRLALRALSLAYGGAIAARRGLYSAGVLPSRSLPVPVICFGNISSGGTGKTSTVITAAQELVRMGRRPAILLRGYKRRRPTRQVVVLARGRSFTLDESGDEALMLYRTLEADNVPVLVGADRYRSGLAAVRDLGADVILMDDGFQHFSLRRDADIVLVNATAPFYSDAVLPYGDLREPAAGLARARAVIISHCEQAQQAAVDTLAAEIARLNPSAEIIETMHAPEFFLDPATARPVDLNLLKGRPAAALSAIGDPDSFEGALRKMKVDLRQIWRYPDHHAFTAEELAAAQEARAGLPLITTYKDFARFPAGWQDILKGGVLILSVKIVFLCDGWRKLSAVLTQTAGRKP
ncbi:MAG: tetraacyldisaccharide 4'-kinase [Elusimicrobiales bacterium]|nr:tetraacyldisaccharide 4'-kinase [Elusimicrobiales bacterium]